MTEPTSEIARDRDSSSKHVRFRVRRAKVLHSGWQRGREPKELLASRRGGQLLFIRPEWAPDVIPEGIQLEPGELLDPAAAHPITDKFACKHFDMVENGEHAGLVAFQSESQERGRIAYENKLRQRVLKLQRRADRLNSETEEQRAERLDRERKGMAFMLRHIEQKAEVKDRWDNGFFFPGGTVADFYYQPFQEFFGKGILRSKIGSPSIARAAQIIPRVKSGLRVGNDKTMVAPVWRKIFGSDAPYVELDPRFARIIAIELDGVFSSEQDCCNEILKILGQKLMPNLIVGRCDMSGNFARPHLIWFMKQSMQEDGAIRDSSVWLDAKRKGHDDKGDKRCRTRPIGFYRQVRRGLMRLLLPLGADPQFRNCLKPKNPLSPFWVTIVANDDYWPELKDFFSVPTFRIDVTDAQLNEEFGLLRLKADGVSPKKSNLVWETVGKIVEPMARIALKQSEPSFVRAHKDSLLALATWFEDRVRPIAEAELLEELAEDPTMLDRLRRVIWRRSEFAAKYCRSRGGAGGKRRGRDRDVRLSVDDPQERKRIAGSNSRKQRHVILLHEMRKMILFALQDAGRPLTKAELIKEYAVAKKTFAYNNWEEAINGLSSVEFRDGSYRYIGCPVSASPLSICPENHPSIAPEAVVGVSVVGNSAPRCIQEADPGRLDPLEPDRSIREPVLEPA